MADVTVPQWVLVGLAGGLFVASLSAAFLAGRLTAPEGAPLPSTSGAPTAAAPAVPSPTSSPSVATSVSAPAPSAPAAARPAAAPSPDCSDPTTVSRYLSAMEQSVSMGKTWSDPNQLAQAIVSDALAGRTDGIDQLVASNQAVLERVQAISPPASCADCSAHHAATVEVLRASLDLLGGMRTGIATGDLDALMSAQGRATALEQRAREIESLDDDIRARCGGGPG